MFSDCLYCIGNQTRNTNESTVTAAKQQTENNVAQTGHIITEAMSTVGWNKTGFTGKEKLEIKLKGNDSDKSKNSIN